MDDFKISMAAARVNANKTQAEVAEALHVGKQTVVSWENGKKREIGTGGVRPRAWYPCSLHGFRG